MVNVLRRYWDGMVTILYPRLCLACDEPLVRGEEFACSNCMYMIRRTNFHLIKDNPVAQLFYGRIELVFATAYFGFDKQGVFQKLMHSLKYKNEMEVGEMLGNHLGGGLQNSPFLPPIDAIIPVPLHKKKKRLRGYNQSEYIAQGISSVLGVKIDTSTLRRCRYSASQTKLSREKRWDNVANNFVVSDKIKLKNKHVLIVDDVLTTGATIEACYEALQEIEGIQVSVAILARA